MCLIKDNQRNPLQIHLMPILTISAVGMFIRSLSCWVIDSTDHCTDNNRYNQNASRQNSNTQQCLSFQNQLSFLESIHAGLYLTKENITAAILHFNQTVSMQIWVS